MSADVHHMFPTLIGLFTALLIVVFIAVVAWAWSDRRKPGFDAAARLPLEEDPPTPSGRPPESHP